ncbi:di-heme oxidoreductase family protein [Marivirga harenae]|uniref:di-heme oxidoreductase family protein n=1 Tax=Marivirga harenae TaxID=2010992 RepID=UPI0026E0E409|nr:di-heme oxidoredictase family protein [Marivirga harenae]WKV13318.1 di-heme oxidoredictase family protein [Marivirga harenae]
MSYNAYFLALLIAAIILNACGSKSTYQAVSETAMYPGGRATTDDFSVNAFGHAAPNISSDQQMQFVTGNAFFKRNWVTAPSSTADLDGLGALFNAKSCSSCHFLDGKGEPGFEKGQSSALLFRLSVPTEGGKTKPEPNYGNQFNHLAILGEKEEGQVEINYEEIIGAYPDGERYSLRKPLYTFTQLNYGSMQQDVLVSPRVAPHIIGLGLLEAIAADDILALSDPQDHNSDGISGRPNYVKNVLTDNLQLGRFGWKANEPNVRQQVAAAFQGDMGLSSSLFPAENETSNQGKLIQAANGGNPEVSDDILDRVTLYSQVLAVPKRREPNSEKVMQGAQLFSEIGCSSCHNPSFTTAQHNDIPEFGKQKIYPYTDLLVHDMGEELADQRPDGDASGVEWRTAPLWGIGLVKTVNGHTTLLHDGRARNVEEAILWHGGEAERTKTEFKNLSKIERENLISFVNSL